MTDSLPHALEAMAETSRGRRDRNAHEPVGVQSRILRRTSLPRDGLSLYDGLAPAFRAIDRVPTPVGLSLWPVAKTTGIASARATNA